MARRPSKKREHDQIDLDSDAQFAYITGYTAGGAPYGVTWEEQEESERRAANVRQINVTMLEAKHKNGYERHPVGKTEFSVWESEQEWGD